MQEEEFCLEGLKKTQEEQYPVFKPALTLASGFWNQGSCASHCICVAWRFACFHGR
jgi:hypothetical protein